jgi:hypothetical protein
MRTKNMIVGEPFSESIPETVPERDHIDERIFIPSVSSTACVSMIGEDETRVPLLLSFMFIKQLIDLPET